MSNKKPTNPFSKPLAILSLVILIASALSLYFESIGWLMDYLIWGWAACFGILAVWAILSLRYGLIVSANNMGRLRKTYRSKEPIFFFFMVAFYFLLGFVGCISLVFILLSGK